MNDASFDAACDQFEASWKAGDPPSMEDYLRGLEFHDRSRLLTELLQIEIWWRRNEPAPPTKEQYQARFAGLEEAVEAAFDRLAMSTSRSVQPQPDSLESTAFETGQDESGHVGGDEGVPGEPVGDRFVTLGPEEQSQAHSAVKQLCDAWQSADETGSIPKVRDFMPEQVSVQLRELILRELLVADIQFRKQANQQLPTEEYLSQFPGEKPVVESAIKLSSVIGRSGAFYQATTEAAQQSGTVKGFPSAGSLGATGTTTRYVPTKLHARGGLGVIFRAKDQELNRTVALKEIKSDHAMEPINQARFMFEAEVTGSLEHPGIVPVYGLGRYSDDRPYYAMRFIRGSSFKKVIADFHREHPSLTASVFYSREFKSLLRRLIEACNAIHYAHEHGVLHRDIKPDNIMIGRYGETLVVDWGLAKVMELQEGTRSADSDPPRLSISSGNVTSIGSAMGTPQYMSPEQAFGHHDKLSFPADVYSLGAVLFNIITGQHPIDARNGREIVLKVQRGDVRDIREIVPTTPGALVSIVNKAMHLQADERYPTALEFADDIDNWLNDEIVQAHVRSETFAEKSGRLIRRYRSWTLSGATALLVITLVAITATIWISRARHQEQLAKQQARGFKQEAVARYRDSREAINTWLVQSDQAMRFLPGTQSIRQRMLELASEDYAKLAASSSRDPDLELERGRILLRLGDLNQMQQKFADAREKYQQAIELFRKSIGGEPPTVEAKAEQANARMRMGLSHAAEENLDQAEAEYQRAIEQLRVLKNTHAESAPMIVRFLATAHANLGELLIRMGDHGGAASELKSSLDHFESLNDVPGDAETVLAIARVHELLGRNDRSQGELQEAVGHFRSAASTLGPVVERHPDHPEYLDALASVLVSLANAHRAAGEIQDEIDSLRAAAKHFRALRIAMPDMPLYTENLSLTLTDLGLALHGFDQTVAARETLLEAYELSANLVDAYGQVPRFRVELAACQDALGQVLLCLEDDATNAAELLAAAVMAYDDLIKQFPEQPQYIQRMAVAQSHYAQSLNRLGRQREAVENLKQALGTLQLLVEAHSGNPSFQDSRAHVAEHLGWALLRKDGEDAERFFAQARDWWTRLIDQAEHVPALNELSRLLAVCPVESIHDPGQSIEYASAAVASAPRNPRYTTTLALARLVNGEPARALSLIEQSRELRDAADGYRGREWLIRAIAQHRLNEHDQAMESLAQARQWLAENSPHDQEMTQLLKMAELEIGKKHEE